MSQLHWSLGWKKIWKLVEYELPEDPLQILLKVLLHNQLFLALQTEFQSFYSHQKWLNGIYGIGHGRSNYFLFLKKVLPVKVLMIKIMLESSKVSLQIQWFHSLTSVLCCVYKNPAFLLYSALVRFPECSALSPDNIPFLLRHTSGEPTVIRLSGILSVLQSPLTRPQLQSCEG